MRKLAWPVLLGASTAFAFWVVLGPWLPQHSWGRALVVLFFLGHPIGTFWMLIQVLRRGEKEWRFLWLVFVCYAFLWYYFERVRRTAQPRSAQV